MPSTVHHGSFRKTTTYKEIRLQERTYTVTLIKWIPFKIFFFFGKNVSWHAAWNS